MTPDARAGECAHITAGLGDQHLSGSTGDAGDRAQQLDRWRQRSQLLLDRVGEFADRFVEVVDVREDAPDDQRVLRVEAALERFAERREFGAQLALSEVSEHVGVTGACDQRVDHGAPGLAQRLSRSPWNFVVAVR
jgi:hypothetical protein